MVRSIENDVEEVRCVDEARDGGGRCDDQTSDGNIADATVMRSSDTQLAPLSASGPRQ
jgi:hypothetical protein